MGQNKTGASGENLYLKVPIGTEILDDDKITVIADLIKEGDTVLLAEGGKGGAGNITFKNSVNQAPRKIIEGSAGEEKWIWLKLKLIADVGLVGMPNAGKSSFIKTVTGANAKVANYPFSTIKPQLGVIKTHDREIVIADIPGLIKDAHLGKGLGDKFLTHIERCRLIVHIIDISENAPLMNYKIIRNELEQYGKSLLNKPEIIILNKCDLLEKNFVSEIKNQFAGKKVFTMSVLNKSGIKEVVSYIGSVINNVVYEEW